MTGAVADRRRGILDRRLAAEPAPQCGIGLQGDDPVVADRDPQRRQGRFAVRHVDQLDDGVDRLPDGLGFGPSGHHLGDGIQQADAQVGVADDHGVADRVQRHLHALFFLIQRALGLLAFADVMGQHEHALHLAVLDFAGRTPPTHRGRRSGCRSARCRQPAPGRRNPPIASAWPSPSMSADVRPMNKPTG